MFDREKDNSANDDFWNLDEYIKKNPSPQTVKAFPRSATEAVTVDSDSGNGYPRVDVPRFNDVALTQNRGGDNGTITRFIPPHKNPDPAKKHILLEYTPENPLIKSVKICSEKQGEQIFVDSNLFIRERRALLNRKASECPYTAYYSYSPRYSQMSRAQLNYYLWWRENTRNGIFLKTDESYIILYAYELAATGAGEDKKAALSMLCALLQNYTDKDINTVYRLMIRDIICDFCLVHALPSPLDRLTKLNRQLMANSYLPEFFVDLSDKNRAISLEVAVPSISMYDYRRSRYYSDANAKLFKSAMNGAVAAVFEDEAAFKTVTSFTSGVYSCVTAERRPFARMINIVNKSIKLEINYYQLSNVQPFVTDAMRYAENKIREHLGIKNKLHILTVNPHVKAAIDAYFDANYPRQPVIDRRRKNTAEKANEVHEYDRFYDVPKSELSPERAMEIERSSWETTKILTEAFSDSDTLESAPQAEEYGLKMPEEPLKAPEKIATPEAFENSINLPQKAPSGDLWDGLCGILGDVAQFITLCHTPNLAEQRKFAAAHSLTADEIADTVNECAVNLFGDIVLEERDGAYVIIEDYIDQF